MEISQQTLIFLIMDVYLTNVVPVKVLLFEQAGILKTENYAIPFATRGLDPCLTGVLLE